MKEFRNNQINLKVYEKYNENIKNRTFTTLKSIRKRHNCNLKICDTKTYNKNSIQLRTHSASIIGIKSCKPSMRENHMSLNYRSTSDPKLLIFKLCQNYITISSYAKRR